MPILRRKKRTFLVPNRKRKGRGSDRKRRKVLGEGWQAIAYKKDLFSVRKEYKRSLVSSRRKKVKQESAILKKLNRTGVSPKLRGTGRNYVDMEFIPGEMLEDKVSGSARRQKKYGKRLAKAVKKVHKQNVVHNDLHHKNILVSRGKVKILDYGQAKMRNRPLTPRERRKDINRILKSHKGKELQPLRESFVVSYGVV